jgi:hypothetical protein
MANYHYIDGLLTLINTYLNHDVLRSITPNTTSLLIIILFLIVALVLAINFAISAQESEQKALFHAIYLYRVYTEQHARRLRTTPDTPTHTHTHTPLRRSKRDASLIASLKIQSLFYA